MLFVVWPLTQDCRQRARSHGYRRKSQHDVRPPEESGVESRLLLPLEVRDYGTSDDRE
jgi:hypothetical protein